MKILFTGFDPFGGESINPAWEAVRGLPDVVAGAEIVKQQLPTIYGKAGEVLTGAIEREKPDAVVCVGQAGGRTAISLERIAVNLRDSAAKDNAGRTAEDEAIIPGGKTAYFATIPVKRIRDAIAAEGIAAGLSNSAGCFVCNDAMYTLLWYLEENYPGVRGGFVHVPFIPEQTKKREKPTYSMELREITRALEIAAGVLAKMQHKG
ncbi:MAG: pyroglutamyl-peptidase I [Clostridia bacterium]|nr:pyroglutamyl-peptidase I [Clostridia bacterium]